MHLRTPGQEHKEDLDSGTRAAAAGGYVAVVAMPNTDPTVDSAPVLLSLREQARREARVPVGFTASITRGLAGEALTEMAELRDAGALAFTDDGKPVHRAGILRKALQYQRLAGGVLCLHEEDPSLSGRGVMHEGAVSARLGLAGIPSISESTLIARDAALAGYEDGRIHIQHLSARESVEAVAEAKARGVQITAEVSPHHLTLTHEALLEELDTRLKMNPPLRAEEDRQALIEGLRDGTIDCIATDHAPHAREEKEMPFEEAPMGTTGLETAFAAIYTELVLPGVLPLALVVDRMSSGAALLDLPLPAIEVGRPADFCLVDLEAEWEVGEHGYESRAENCCFAGRTLRGRVLATVAAGGVAFRERAFAVVGMKAYVLLEDGERFDGKAVGARAAVTGEVVFTTGMSGYQESMTDPSFARQLITFTTAHVGNYGVSAEAWESDRIHAAGAIMREAINTDDAPGAEQGWLDWLAEHGIPGIAGRRHARAGAAHPLGGRDARRDLPGLDVRGRRPRPRAGRAVDGRPRPRARGDARRTPHRRRGRLAADRRARHGDQAVDRRQLRQAWGSARAIPLHDAGRRAARARPRRVLPRARAGRPGGARLRRRHHPLAARPQAGVRDLPRPPAALARGRAWRPSSCRSGTAAPTTRSRTSRPAGSPSPRRTTASRWPESPARGSSPTSAPPS